MVDIFQRELVKQISLMHRVHFHAIHARVLQHLGALRESLHELVDFVHRHLTGRHLVRPAVGGRAGGGGNFVQVHERFGKHPQGRIRIQRLHQLANRE